MDYFFFNQGLYEPCDSILPHCIGATDQTAEEMKRTEQFGLELVDLLKHNPQCRMIFNRFIPAYHHHFGRQCRVSDYGFTRLTDLFESVPHVVEVGLGLHRLNLCVYV